MIKYPTTLCPYMSFKRILLAAVACLTVSVVNGQQKNDMSTKLLKYAIQLEDEGKLDSALYILTLADSLLPGNPDIKYEISYYYFQVKNYNKCIEIGEHLKKEKKNRQPNLYQLLGNCYDYIGDSAKSIATYNEGIEEFPNSGNLFLEIGNCFALKKRYGEALSYYENGIQVQPTFPSNYYRAAQIWLGTESPVWGMMYCEIFMNLERGSKRTEQASKWLGDAYRDNIKITTSDSSTKMSITLHKLIIDAGDKKTIKDIKKGKFELPFGALYEKTIMLSILSMDSITYENTCKIREAFLDNWYKDGNNKSFPNVLFEYQNTIKEKGYLNAYNHWLLSSVYQDEFNDWRKNNRPQSDEFLTWFSNHPIEINKKNMFLKTNEE